MSRRTTPVAEHDLDAEVHLDAIDGGSRITLTQAGSPPGQASSYEAGWEQLSFAPLRAYVPG